MTIDIKNPSSSDHMELARMIAAQCWCDEKTKNIAMDARLAEAFAKRLASWMNDAARYSANAGYWRVRSENAERELATEREKVSVMAEFLRGMGITEIRIKTEPLTEKGGCEK